MYNINIHVKGTLPCYGFLSVFIWWRLHLFGPVKAALRRYYGCEFAPYK